MSISIQTGLNDRAHICGRDPCGYHASRVDCVFHAEYDVQFSDVGDNSHAFLVSNRGSRNLAGLFSKSGGPAGSWYLVREQREWLTSRIRAYHDVITHDDPVRILVSGIAGHAHFLGYLLAICEALSDAASACERDIEITVVDRCAYPLVVVQAAVAAIDRPGLFGCSFKIAGKKYTCDKRLISGLRSHADIRSKLKLEFRQQDLSERSESLECHFDLITEHFLTSLLDKDFKSIEPIRRNYAAWLRDGGRVLTADGLAKNASRYTEYLELCAQCGLDSVPGTAVPAWDPYGLGHETLQRIAEAKDGERFPVSRDNTLTEFVKS